MKKTFKKSFAVLTALLMLLCILPVGVFAEGDIPIDEAHFPDAIFRAYVSENCDTDGSGVLSSAEIAAVTSINVSWMEIADLTGIEYFTALKRLVCCGNQLTQLDVSNNTALTELDCSNNQLTSLDVSKNTALTGESWSVGLDCSYNQLTELDVSKNTALTGLYCGYNQLTQLDVSKNTALKKLDCSGNRLTQLDVSKNTALTQLYCSANQLTSLDVSNNTALWDFGCYGNQYKVSSNPFNLTTLPGNFDVTKASNWQGATVEGNILTFVADISVYTYDCGNGESAWFTLLAPESFTPNPPLGEIAIDKAHFPDVNFRRFVLTGGWYDSDWNKHKIDADGSGALSPAEIAAVKIMEVGWMDIADLTGIEYFTALEQLNCENNQLISLDVSKNIALSELICGSNYLTTLDVSNNINLTYLQCGRLEGSDWEGYYNALTSLDVSNNVNLEYLSCECNELTSLNVNGAVALRVLECGGNELTSLDLSSNTALEYLDCSGNSYQVSSNPFDLTTLPGNFDVLKASNWQGAAVNGTILTFTAGFATYTYDCGNGRSAEFNLLAPDGFVPPVSVSGDYDCNGVVNVQDAILTLRAAMGLITPSEQSLLNADMDNNGIITVTDAITVLRMAMGLI